MSATTRRAIHTACRRDMSCFGCFCRVMILVFINTVGIGGTAIVVFKLVRSHTILVLLVPVNASIYLVFCITLFPWSSLGRCLRGVGVVCCSAWRAGASPGPWSATGDDGDSAFDLLEIVVQTQGQVTNVFPRDAPLPGGGLGRVVAAGDIPAYEQQAGAPSECPVCLGVIDKGEMVNRLPVCLHVFHHQCIWLHHHPMCTVCQSKVFTSLPLPG